MPKEEQAQNATAGMDMFQLKKSIPMIDAQSSLFQYSVVNYVVLSKHSFILEKLRLTRFTSFSFAQTTIHDFLKYRFELIVSLSSTNATKTSALLFFYYYFLFLISIFIIIFFYFVSS